jgi:hypothetical protein
LIKKIFILFFVIICASCPGHQSGTIFLSNNYEKIYKRSVCESDKPFPQMVILPFFKRATQVVPNCDTYPKHKTALAIIIFYHHWLKNFGDDDLKIKKALEKVMITWGVEKRTIKKSYNIRGEAHKNSTVVGITKSDSVIWVWQGYNHKISESSLIHELVHIALRAKYGHGDSDHEGKKYDGWTFRHTEMILKAKESLRAFNL